MQVPTRRAQRLKPNDDPPGANQMTAQGLKRLQDDLSRLERERPDAIAEVQRLAQLGDFSENAEYQEAKYRLRKINDRMASIKDRLMRAVIIQTGSDATGRVQLGSRVTLRAQPHPDPLLRKEREKTFQIVGPRESNPSRGRISHLSPVGAALIGHAAGDTVIVQTESDEMRYEIVRVE